MVLEGYYAEVFPWAGKGPRRLPPLRPRQTWQDFKRQVDHQIQAGTQAEKELPAARALLSQIQQALPQVRQRVKDMEAAPALKRLVALDEAQRRLKTMVVRSRTASGQVVTREVVRGDAKPTRALSGIDILLQGLLGAT